MSSSDTYTVPKREPGEFHVTPDNAPNSYSVFVEHPQMVIDVFRNVVNGLPAHVAIGDSQHVTGFLRDRLIQLTLEALEKDGAITEDKEAISGYRALKGILLYDTQAPHEFAKHAVRRVQAIQSTISEKTPLESYVAADISTDLIPYEKAMEIKKTFLKLLRDTLTDEAPTGKIDNPVILNLGLLLKINDSEVQKTAKESCQ